MICAPYPGRHTGVWRAAIQAEGHRKMVNVNSDNRLADILNELKRHLKSCSKCTGAMKVRDQRALCDHTVGLILTAAWNYDTVIPRRITAGRKKDPRVFACPDLSKHGKAYSMTAEPLIVSGVQDGLW
jgi:hypothetical protein